MKTRLLLIAFVLLSCGTGEYARNREEITKLEDLHSAAFKLSKSYLKQGNLKKAMEARHEADSLWDKLHALYNVDDKLSY